MARTFTSRAQWFADIATIAALIFLVATVVSRPKSSATGTEPLMVERTLSDSLWTAAWNAAHRDGSDSARVRLLQFTDFECPVCRRFATEAREVLVSHRAAVAMGLLHHPLSQHRFARRAALVAECVPVGHFWEAYDSLLARQLDFGLVPWSRLLGREITEDQISDCLDSEMGRRTLEVHATIGEAVGVPGTPLLVVNGRVLSRPPSRVELDSIVRAEMGEPRR